MDRSQFKVHRSLHRDPDADGSSPSGSELIRRWCEGDRGALPALWEELADELRAMAHRALGEGWRPRPMETTDLLHELYLRLYRTGVDVEDERHLFAVILLMMRHLLVDEHRSRKRREQVGSEVGVQARAQGGSGIDLNLSELKLGDPVDPSIGLVVSELIDELEKEHPRVAIVARSRIFVGLTIVEIAAAAEVTDRTVKSDWRFARAWLASRLRDAES